MARSWPPIPAYYARLLVEELERVDISTAGWLAKSNIRRDALYIPSETLPCDVYTGFVTGVLSEIDLPGLGLRVGDRFDYLEAGLLGYAFACCRTLANIFTVNRYFSPLVNRFIPGTLAVVGNTATFTFDTKLVRQSYMLMRYELEKEYTVWFQGARLWQRPDDWFSEVRFSFPRPGYAELYEKQFRCPVKFNQMSSQFVFDAKYLNMPFIDRKEQVVHLPREQASGLLAGFQELSGLSEEIRAILLASNARYPSFEQVSRHLNMSPATLRRHLAREGTSYKQLLKEFRLEVACRFLRETELSATEISYLTGYKDPTCFSRAFKRSYELTPLAFREKVRQAGNQPRGT